MSDQYAFNIFTSEDEAERPAFPTAEMVSSEPEGRVERHCEAPNSGAFDALSARILEMSANRQRMRAEG